MRNRIVTTLSGEVIGVYSPALTPFARIDAYEIVSITREPLALHYTPEDECVLQVGDRMSMSGRYEVIK